MEPWLVITISISSFSLLVWSFRELTRWYLRLNTLEDKIDYLHKMLQRIEDNLAGNHTPTEEGDKPRQALFLIKERSDENSPTL